VTQTHRDLFSLDGRVAIVNGGSSGLGKAMAAGLARYGARVAVASSNAAKCAAAAEELRRDGGDFLSVPTDVSDPAAAQAMVARTLDHWGRVDVLINSAGISQGVPALEMSPQEWRRVLAVDLDGAFYCCQAAGRAMAEAGKGSIVNITSMSGMLGYADQAAYCAAKGGLTLLTRALAVEWGHLGVRVNAIAPTWFYTPISAHILDDPTQLAQKLKSIPLDRVGQGDDIVGAAVFLASDASAFVTGHVLCVDGGKFALLGEW
jgi:NAD(P)-dependent dehydrogenase (short-subunit alcohol dehydrogenase family)